MKTLALILSACLLSVITTGCQKEIKEIRNDQTSKPMLAQR